MDNNHIENSLVSRDALFFRSGDRRMRVSLDRITHISAASGLTVIHSVGRRYPTAYELSEVFSQLPLTHFYRVHPLHIVALQHVRGMEGKEVLVGDERIFTTRYYRAQLVEALGRRRSSVPIRIERDILS